MQILKFKPIYKERIWGGRELEKFGKKLPKEKSIGESWELSGVDGDVSVVSNGTLKGNNLSELVEVYMGDLVGEKNFEKFGEEFPLLIKLIDAQDYLSIQVHPDDALAAERHNSYGKTEMWYVVDCQEGASLYVGFNQKVDKAKYLEFLERGELEKLLRSYPVKKGDTFFIPAGAIHAIGKGILIAEIQQTSDITYRVYDFNRKDPNGNSRELHTEQALDAIDYSVRNDYNVTALAARNEVVRLVSCPYFETNTLEVDGAMIRDFAALDSFVIYVCIEGEVHLATTDSAETLKKGETALVPADVDEVAITGSGLLLESYIP
ncbi:Mannose-6-phosphate isomerase [Mucinivorans hirudinis]|uniref:Phosphohexomutase n=1 Tax=Mucinivorans hirudinis TaxID=1433126 RepID=A0A060RBN0_9BACT|nr:Mannose-6-phosphate isomerase [Mucinivorans hirudinis]